MEYSTHQMKLSELAKRLDLSVEYRSNDFESIKIKQINYNRPGLQLAGFFDYFTVDRIQLVGRMETAYMNSLPTELRRERARRLISAGIPAIIFCHEVTPDEMWLQLAQEHDVTILRTDTDTQELVKVLIEVLTEEMAPRITRHGVFVEVYGEGVLLVGESGIGKSETAIELIKRGHRLIADDAVEIKRVDSHTLIGSAPELIRYYIELRGIGIIDVRRIFGSGAIKLNEEIDLVVEIENWNQNSSYDRLGIANHTMNILGVEVPHIKIPVNPGRNLAVILEVAAMNNRQKKMGYNSALEFTEQIDRKMEEGLF